MDSEQSDILILDRPIAAAGLVRLAGQHFEGMVKYVVDVRRGVIAIGGAMHADGEAALLEHGSRQSDLWGANYYPGRGRAECIEYVSMINIRPREGNRSMELLDERLRARVQEVTFALIGSGEEPQWPPSTRT